MTSKHPWQLLPRWVPSRSGTSLVVSQTVDGCTPGAPLCAPRLCSLTTVDPGQGLGHLAGLHSPPHTHCLRRRLHEGRDPCDGMSDPGTLRRGPAATERTHEGCWHGFGLLLLVQCQSVHTLVTLHLAWVCVRTHGQTGVYVCLYVMVPAFQRVFFMLFFTPFSHRFSNFLPIGDLMLM